MPKLHKYVAQEGISFTTFISNFAGAAGWVGCVVALPHPKGHIHVPARTACSAGAMKQVCPPPCLPHAAVCCPSRTTVSAVRGHLKGWIA